LFGWILPNIETLAVNVGNGIKEFLSHGPTDRPFDDMSKLSSFHLLSLDHHTLYVCGFNDPVSALLEAVLPNSVRYLRVSTFPGFTRLSSMTRVFANVLTLNVDPHVLKWGHLSKQEPRLLLRNLPSVTKIFVKWDLDDKYRPTSFGGIDFMQHVYDSLGDQWEGETRVVETLQHGRRATGVRFLKR
jgi:hypothetical protein